MDLQFKPGDRVRLTREGVALYGGAWPHFVPQAQGGGADGTVLVAGERPHKQGAAPRPYYVRWDNGVENSYRVDDLEAALDTEAELDAEGEEEGFDEDVQPSNIVPFRRFQS